MYRVLVVFLLMAGPLGAKQLLPNNTDTIPCDPTVHVQQTFCPNCEAWSDYFSPDFTGKLPVEYQMGIYDKDGFLIFSTDNIDKGWNGQIKDAEAKLVVYNWRMSYRYEKEGPWYSCNGTVALIQ